MKWLILLLASCLMVAGQPWTIMDGALLAQAVASGAVAPSGPPGITLSATNAGLNVTTLTTNITVSGANTYLLWYVSWYNAAGINTPTWNGSSAGVTLMATNNWLNAGSGGLMRIYYLASPSAGTAAAAVTFPVSEGEANLIVQVLTNCSGFDNFYTNYLSGSHYQITNAVPSTAGETMFSFMVDADSPNTTLTNSWKNVVIQCMPGSGHHTAAIGSTNGVTTSTLTNIWGFLPNPTSIGVLHFGAKGF